MTESKQNQCMKCGEDLAEGTIYCGHCGRKVSGEPNFVEHFSSAERIKEFSFTKEKFSGLKTFISNNFELVHFLYLLVFIGALISAKLGILLFLVLCIAGYILSVIYKGKEVKANKQLISMSTKVYAQSETALKSIHEDLKAKDEQSIGQTTVEPSPNTMPIKGNDESLEIIQEDVYASNGEKTQIKETKENQLPFQNVTKDQATKIFLTSAVLLAISCFISLYGVFGAGFLKIMNGSLFTMLNTTGRYAGYLDQAREMLGSSSSGEQGMIMLVKVLLIVFPFVIGICGISSIKPLQIIAMCVAVLELGFFFYIASYVKNIANSVLGDYSDTVSDFVSSNQSEIFGAPFYALLFGAILMVLFSIILFIFPSKTKKILSFK